jgi:hypothetical protein
MTQTAVIADEGTFRRRRRATEPPNGAFAQAPLVDDLQKRVRRHTAKSAGAAAPDHDGRTP